MTSSLLAAGCAYVFAPTSLDGIDEASIRAQCHFAFSCCTAPERAAFIGLNFKDEGACVGEQLEQGSELNNVLERAKAAVAAKKGTFDQKRADECLKPLFDAENSCDSATVLGGGTIADGLCDADVVRGFVKGTVKDGGACDDDIECADFGVCDTTAADPSTVSTKGKCKAAKNEGDICEDPDTNETFACVPGTQCNADDAGAFTCQQPALLDDGATCTSGKDCKGGFCNVTTVSACSFSGDPCQVNADCIDGDTCDSVRQQLCANQGPKVEACDGL